MVRTSGELWKMVVGYLGARNLVVNGDNTDKGRTSYRNNALVSIFKVGSKKREFTKQRRKMTVMRTKISILYSVF